MRYVITCLTDQIDLFNKWAPFFCISHVEKWSRLGQILGLQKGISCNLEYQKGSLYYYVVG